MSLLDTASLIVTPNAYKEGKLYSVIPSDGSGDLSVTRATTATRVNSQGLVERVPYNLVTYSQKFDNADWLKQGGGTGTTPSVTANYTAAPDGTLTADRIQFSKGSGTTSSDFALVIQGDVNLTSNGTLSIYLKSNTGSTQNVLAYWSNGQGAVFQVTSQWQRFTINNITAAFAGIHFGTRGGTGNFFNGGDNTLDISLWGGQVNEGTLKDYQATETRLNIPRLDYSNGSCPSLLVEPQRTNLCTYSEDFTNVVWGKFLTTITPNTTISPSGVQNADTFETSSNSSGVLFINSFVTSGDKTFSIYAKKGSNDILDMGFTDVTDFTARFNLSSGTLVSQTSGLTSTITSVGNDWYRLTVSKNISALGSIFLINLTPSINKTMFLWGAQLEAGAYPTSYIPTTSASVTRNDDFISKTSATSLIGQTEGTIFVDFYNDGNTIYNPFSISDGYYGDAIYFEQFLGQMYGVIWDGGSQQFSFNAGALSIGNHKMAIAYKTNDIAFYIDGVLKATDSSATIPTCSRIDVGYLASATVYKTFINAAALWKTRLTNAQLAQLTTI
jgi:hypothetical protein